MSHFVLREDIKGNLMSVLNGFLENDSQQYLQLWKTHWIACMKAEGKYFEGEHTLKVSENIYTYVCIYIFSPQGSVQLLNCLTL